MQPVKSSRVLYLPSGTGATIISYLHRGGIDVNRLDRHLLRFFGYPQQGWIDIGTTRLTKADFLSWGSIEKSWKRPMKSTPPIRTV